MSTLLRLLIAAVAATLPFFRLRAAAYLVRAPIPFSSVFL